MKKKIKVIIVDDSKLIRTLFSRLLNSAPDIEVVDTAADPFEAREKIKKFNPDVITLDIEMPKMDGISFLEKIMTLRPLPVIMISSHTKEGADITLKALEIGAVDYLAKPSDNTIYENPDLIKDELIMKVRSAALANVSTGTLIKNFQQKVLEFTPNANSKHKVIAIGASTGGVEAIRQIITKLPENCPPVVITQHMPQKFTEAFAIRLNNLTRSKVQEATSGQKLATGNVYVAPGGKHMKIVGSRNTGYAIEINDGELVTGHKPSVDYMFHSIADVCGSDAVGVILTGMGKDGAEGMLRMKQAGAFNIGQSEDTCVVYGMPRAAFECKAIDIQTRLDQIPEEILKHC